MIYCVTRFCLTIKYSFFWVWRGLTMIPILWRIFALREPRISFLGGGRLALTDHYAQQARALARLCAQHEMSIITGGGRGIMQAAALGVQDAGKKKLTSIGIGLTGVDESVAPVSGGMLVRVDNLIMRKWLMINFSSVHVIFPGGVGTQNEFTELLALIDMNLLHRLPVILFGKEYWQPLLDWMRHEGVAHGVIRPEVLNYFILVDQVEEAYDCIVNKCSLSAR